MKKTYIKSFLLSALIFVELDTMQIKIPMYVKEYLLYVVECFFIYMYICTYMYMCMHMYMCIDMCMYLSNTRKPHYICPDRVD
jgi:hypothetical protein